MVRYELKKASAEIPFSERKNIKPGCTLNQPDIFVDEVIDIFDTREEAMEALAKRKTNIRKYSYVNTYFLIEEYFVEVAEYDDDGFISEEIDILDFSRMVDDSGIQ